MKPEAVVTPSQMGVPFGRRSLHVRVPYSMPNHIGGDIAPSVKRKVIEILAEVDLEIHPAKAASMVPTIGKLLPESQSHQAN